MRYALPNPRQKRNVWLKITLRNAKKRKPLDNRSKPRRRSFSRKNNTLVVFAGLGCVFGSEFLGIMFGKTTAGSVIAVSGVSIGFILAFYGLSRAFIWKAEVRAVIETENIEQIGILVEALGLRNRWGNCGNTPEARQRVTAFYEGLDEVLIRLLPQLQSGDIALLTKEQRTILYQSLQGRDSYLVEAILKGLMQIDDQGARPAITELANGKWKAEQDTSLRALAQECLAQLQRNREQEEVRHNLLRASQNANYSSANLLHTALPDEREQASKQLLRANKD